MSEPCSHVILIGDTNFSSDDESHWLGPRFQDVWQSLYQRSEEETAKNVGLTFDTVTNKMCGEEYGNRNLGEKRQRLDRCYFTHDTLEPISMSILGDQPYLPGTSEFISDHYGVLVKLKLKDLTRDQLHAITEKRAKERMNETGEDIDEVKKPKKGKKYNDRYNNRYNHCNRYNHYNCYNHYNNYHIWYNQYN